MPKIVMEEQEEFPVLPAESILHVKVDDVVVREMQGQRGTWEKLDLKFKVLGVQVTGDGSPARKYDNLIGAEIYGGVPFRLTDHPDNKLRLWVEAILGMSLGVGFELDTDYLLGRECRAITRQFDKKALDPRGIPYKGHGVDTLLAKAGPSTQAPADPWGNQGSQQAPQAPAQQPMTQQVQNPWGNQATSQPTQQPAFSGWGASGTDDPPF